jgi:integrase
LQTDNETAEVATDSDDDAIEALPAYLHLRGGVYYFKRKVPAKWKRLMETPKEEIWVSLETADLALALKKHAMVLSDFEAEMKTCLAAPAANDRRSLSYRPRVQGTTQYLQEAHIPFLLDRYEYAHHTTGDEERSGAWDDELDEQLDFVTECRDALKRRARAADYAYMDDTAEVVLSAEKLIAPPGSDVRTHLLRELMMRDIKILDEQIKRLNGEGDLTPDAEPISPRNMCTLLDAFEAWCPSQSVPRTIETYRGFVGEFESLFGALPVVAITTAQVHTYRDLLAEDGLLRETVKNHVNGLGTLVRFGAAQTKYVLARNPFDNLRFDMIAETPEDQRRRAYEVGELTTLFHSRLYTSDYRTAGQAIESCYWAPLMGPFVGGRIEEIAQLRLQDIQCINGVWALRMATLGPDQKLKNAGSYRMVPLHHEVIECGFLAYAAKQKRAGHERLFPSQRNNNLHRLWSNALGKWFSIYLDSIGLSDPGLDYHSLRFNFKQQLTFCGVQDEARDALSGHWLSKQRSSASRGYMRQARAQYPFPSLENAMKLLRYDQLDLSHLYVDEPMDGVGILLS